MGQAANPAADCANRPAELARPRTSDSSSCDILVLTECNSVNPSDGPPAWASPSPSPPPKRANGLPSNSSSSPRSGSNSRDSQLPVSRLWDPARGTGLLAATISTGGCSAGFVTATGLFLTNHHCLFGIVQEHSRPGRDLITDGFIARSREEELPGKTMRVTVPHRFTDVTKEVEAGVPAGALDLARTKAIESKQKALVAACEKTPGMRCSVAAFDGGLQYVLIETIELTDIRLVYAPPRAIGEFGGEPDNFRWPRHTGDFALGRAYKDGKPYQPEFFFPDLRKRRQTRRFRHGAGLPGAHRALHDRR